MCVIDDQGRIRIDATISWKYRQFDWGLLQGIWRKME